MNDIVGMQQTNRLANVSHMFFYFFFLHVSALFLDQVVKVSFIAELEHQVNRISVIKKCVYLGNVRVVWKSLEFDFASYVSMILWVEFGLWNDFDCCEEISMYVSEIKYILPIKWNCSIKPTSKMAVFLKILNC